MSIEYSGHEIGRIILSVIIYPLSSGVPILVGIKVDYYYIYLYNTCVKILGFCVRYGEGETREATIHLNNVLELRWWNGDTCRRGTGTAFLLREIVILTSGIFTSSLGYRI